MNVAPRWKPALVVQKTSIHCYHTNEANTVSTTIVVGHHTEPLVATQFTCIPALE